MALASRIVRRLPGAWLRRAGKSSEVLRLDPGQDIVSVSVSSDGRWLVTSTHETNTVKIWDAGTGHFVKQLPGRGWGGRFSGDGRWLATSTQLWRVGPTIAEWSEGPEPGPNNGSLLFSPDSRLLAIATTTGHIRLLDARTMREVARLEDPELESSTLAFSPDGSQLIATASGIHVWDLRGIRAELAAKGLVNTDWPSVTAGPLMASAATDGLSLSTQHSPTCRRLETAFAEACFCCAEAWTRVGWRAPALWCYSQAVRLRGDHGEALLGRGEEYLRRQRWAAAIADLNRAAELPTLRHTAILYRSLAYLRLGRHAEAEADRRLLRDAFPDYPAACGDLGILRARSGDLALAAFCFHAVRHFQSNQPKLLNEVAWFYATGPKQLRDSEAAVALAQRAVELLPNEGLYWNTLGVSYYRSGNFQAAVAALNKSLRISAGRTDAFDLYFLAMCHHRLGAVDEARRLLERGRLWHEQQRRRLAPDYAEELRRFRREAEQTLGGLE